MAYGHAERNLACIRQLEADTRQLLGGLTACRAVPGDRPARSAHPTFAPGQDVTWQGPVAPIRALALGELSSQAG
jgi:hypothetical protein